MKEKGFTLIELLVVISIIALLSSVVLSSLNSARAKAADTSVKAAFKQAYTQGEIYRNETGGYGSGFLGSTDAVNCTTGMFVDTRFVDIKTNIISNAATTPNLTCSTASSGKLWAMSVTLKGGASLCIDNSSNIKAVVASAGLCP